MALALEASVSSRHLSFLETGRSNPSQGMVLRLLGALDVPPWDRNRWLLAAGFAPAYTRSHLADDALSPVWQAVKLHLERHEPFPAYAMDGAWNVVAANRAFKAAITSVGGVTEAKGNVLRLLCDPELLRPSVTNWQAVAQAVLHRVRCQLDSPEPPPALAAVVESIRSYPDVDALLTSKEQPLRPEPIIPIEVRNGPDTLRWLTTLVTFGGAQDLAVSELVIECFFPADTATETLAKAMAQGF